MPLSHIEHFLVATDDIEKTGEWYCRAPEMKKGLRQVSFEDPSSVTIELNYPASEAQQAA